MTYYAASLDNHQNGLLPTQHTDFSLRTPYPTFTRVHNNNTNNNNLIEQVVSVNGIHSAPYNNGFQLPTVSSDVVQTPPTTTTQFQLMPHLMNSFI